MRKLFPLLTICFLVLILVRVYPFDSPGDFIEYWSAGKAFLAGNNPYSSEVLLEIQQEVDPERQTALMMWNPPWVLPFVSCVAILNFWYARLFWYLISAGSALLAVDLFWRSRGGPGERRWMSWTVVVWYLPVMQLIILGQITFAPLLGISAFQWFLARNRPVLAGAAVSLTMVKPHLVVIFFLILALWSIREKCWEPIVTTGSIIGLSTLVAAIIFPEILGLYVDAAIFDTGPSRWMTPTIGTLAWLGTHMRSAAYLPLILASIFVGYVWIRTWREHYSWEFDLPTVLLISFVAAPFAWTFDMAILAPVVVGLLGTAVAKQQSWILFALLSTQGLLFISLYFGQNYFHTWWFPLALLGLFLYIHPEKIPWMRNHTS